MGNVVGTDDTELQTSYFKKNFSEKKKLTRKDLFSLHKRTVLEYPWIKEMEESVLVTDNRLKDNPIVYANDQFVSMTGYAKEDIVGKNCRFLQGELTDRATVAKIRNAVKAGQPLDVEILNYRKDGTMFWNNFQMLPVHDRRKRVTHFIALQKDVTLVTSVGISPINWSPVEVGMWLQSKGFQEYGKVAIAENLKGEVLLDLNESDLEEIGMKGAEARRLLEEISHLKSDTDRPISDLMRSDPERKNFLEAIEKDLLPINKWSVQEVLFFLESLNLQNYAQAFVKAKVDGNKLLQFDNIDLLQLGLTQAPKRLLLLRQIKKLTSRLMTVRYVVNGHELSFPIDAGMSMIDVKNQLFLKHPELRKLVPVLRLEFDQPTSSL